MAGWLTSLSLDAVRRMILAGLKIVAPPSWLFHEFEAYLDHSDFFIALILAADIGYQRDIFIFPVRDFVRLVRLAIPSKEQRKVYISRSIHDPTKWYLRRLLKITELTPESVADVSVYRRNFAALNPP